MAFVIGDTVGPYRITEQIGQGGMATVYKAYHANLDRYVAFKVLHSAFKEDPNFLERFRREAQIVAKLEHRHIVPVYDFAAHEGQPYLVMKFVEGETLKAQLKRGPLTLVETITILEAVAEALTFAHEQGILHRDIKPSNIMLDRHGTPFIADFGLARIAQAGESTMSQDMMLGTPQYISPEQAKGIQNLGPGTDIYSLGVVLYEIVVGRVPFSADTPYAIVHDHIYKALPMPSTLNPEVPQQVERVLLRALAKEPDARYESAVDMVAAFRQAVEDANLTELSASRLRPQSISSTAATIPPDQGSPPPTPAYQGVPSPAPSITDSASRTAYRRRANLWILGGFGALLLTCLASLFIIVNAVSDPDLRPWKFNDTANADDSQPTDPPEPGLPGPDTFDPFRSGALEEAQALVEQHPDDPTAYLFLAMAQMNAGLRDEALANISRAIREFDASSSMIAEGARRAANANHDDLAVWLYLEALNQDDVPASVRDEAGSYLFSRAQDDPVEMRTLITQFIGQRAATAPVYTMRALAMLSSRTDLMQRRALDDITSALELDDSLAETYLARGIYFYTIGDTSSAADDLHHALDLPDAPSWVARTARALLEEQNP